MKKLPRTGAGLMLMSALIFAPTFSNAQILSGESTNTLNATVDLNSTTSTSSGSSTVQVDSGTAVDINGTSSSETDSKVTLKVNANGVVVMSASQVNSESDLEIFRSNVSAKEEMVHEVNIDSEADGSSEIEVVYKHYGKLFGVMPVIVKSYTTIETDADGKVEVKSTLPWWSVLVTNKNYAEAELESKIKENSKIKASAAVKLSAEAKAEIVEAVIIELNAHAATHASITQ